MDYLNTTEAELKQEARRRLARIAQLKQEMKQEKAEYDAIIAALIRDNGEEDEE